MNVHLTDKNNKTALHHAAMNCDNADIMLVLLDELSANVYDVDGDGRTALFLATERAMNNEAIPVLIEFGSDVSYKTENLSIICDTIYRQNYETTVLLIRSKKLIKNVVLECILELGIHTSEAGQLGSRWLAEFGADDSFLVSISRGDTLNVASFISTGSAVNKTQGSAVFPLLKAISSNQPHMIEFLVNEGGSFIHEIDNDFDGNGLLHKVPVLEASAECVEILIQQGINVNAVNKKNQTALFTSLAYDRFDIIGVLFQHDPRVDLIDADWNSVLDLAIDRMATVIVGQILSAKSLTYQVLQNAMIKANPITTSTTKLIGVKMLSTEYIAFRYFIFRYLRNIFRRKITKYRRRTYFFERTVPT